MESSQKTVYLSCGFLFVPSLYLVARLKKPEKLSLDPKLRKKHLLYNDKLLKPPKGYKKPYLTDFFPRFLQWNDEKGHLSMTVDKQGSRDSCTIHLVTREVSRDE